MKYLYLAQAINIRNIIGEISFTVEMEVVQ